MVANLCAKIVVPLAATGSYYFANPEKVSNLACDENQVSRLLSREKGTKDISSHEKLIREGRRDDGGFGK